ncbi:MAG: transposase [Chloroflexi bacterium]|nr:transposase [Chloroflexota bacterium]MYK35782.1 transposase [Chloroflexota bacterium]
MAATAATVPSARRSTPKPQVKAESVFSSSRSVALHPAFPSTTKSSTEARSEKQKASVRAKVEHPFLYVKRQFGYAKVRYRGLYKNTQRLAVLFGMANLMRAERLLPAS